MSYDNGASSAGGNGSVWWNVQHGSQRSGIRPPLLANAIRRAADRTPGRGLLDVVLDALDGPPGPGRVKLGQCAEGHDETPFEDIGKPDHPGMFRVRLRFRKQDLEPGKYQMSEQQREFIRLYAKEIPELSDDSVFLEIDVPAIKRDPPQYGDEWPHMPWEIHWGW